MLTGRIQNKHLRLGQLVFVVAVLGCVTLRGETPFDALKSELDQAIDENSSKIASDQKVATTGKLYSERLASLRIEFLNQGSLDGVLEVQDEISRLENSGGIPTDFSSIKQLAHFQEIYAKEIKKIESEEIVGVLNCYNLYGDALLEREEELVRIGFIDKASDVREERIRVKKLIRKLSRKQVDSMTMKYFASYREQEAKNAESTDDVFLRPVDSEAAVPVGENQGAVRDDENLSNQAVEALKAQFNQSLAVHWEMVAWGEQKIYKEYMQELSIWKFHYQSQGSLDGVLAVQAEMKSLEETGALLNRGTELKHLAIVRKDFAQDVMELKSAARERLLSNYRQHFNDTGELERALVKKDLIDEAIVVRKERERVAELMANWAKKDLVLSVFEASQKAKTTSLN
jgi:hypothetical protein